MHLRYLPVTNQNALYSKALTWLISLLGNLLIVDSYILIIKYGSGNCLYSFMTRIFLFALFISINSYED